MAAETEHLVSVREAARRCHRTPETVRRWIWDGKLPARKLGNQLFIREDDLAAVRGTELAVGADGRVDLATGSLGRANRARVQAGGRALRVSDLDLVRDARDWELSNSMRYAAPYDMEQQLALLARIAAINERIRERTGYVDSLMPLRRQRESHP